MAPVWSSVPHFGVVVKNLASIQGTLGNSSCPILLALWANQALSMRCNGRREHYLLELGGTREASLWYFSVLRRWRMAMDLQRCRVEVMSIIRERPSFIGQFCGISYIYVDGSAIT